MRRVVLGAWEGWSWVHGRVSPWCMQWVGPGLAVGIDQGQVNPVGHLFNIQRYATTRSRRGGPTIIVFGNYVVLFCTRCIIPHHVVFVILFPFCMGWNLLCAMGWSLVHVGWFTLGTREGLVLGACNGLALGKLGIDQGQVNPVGHLFNIQRYATTRSRRGGPTIIVFGNYVVLFCTRCIVPHHVVFVTLFPFLHGLEPLVYNGLVPGACG